MLSRRVFLKKGAFSLLSLGFAPSFLTRTASATAPARNRLLVTIFQRGAVDGLSMVVPFGDPEYFKARRSIAVQAPGRDEDAALDLDGFFGLNPRLAPLKRLWDEGTMAIVHACGSPAATRSHFAAQDYMETATPGVKGTRDGWLNRYLRTKADEAARPFRAVALAPELPMALRGRAPALAIADLDRFGIAGRANDRFAESLQSQYAGAGGDLRETGREAFEAMRMLAAAKPAQYQPAHGAEYPSSPFGQALKEIAQLAKANVGLEIAFAELGGWDTHVNQGPVQGALAGRLTDLARGIAAFTTDLGDRMEDIVVLTMSEFGRAVAENGNRGTDHGHGNAMLAIGGRVRGGSVKGPWPGLAVEQRYEGRDLAITTDFRDVFGEIVVRHLGVENPAPIFPGYQISESRFAGLL